MKYISALKVIISMITFNSIKGVFRIIDSYWSQNGYDGTVISTQLNNIPTDFTITFWANVLANNDAEYMYFEINLNGQYNFSTYIGVQSTTVTGSMDVNTWAFDVLPNNGLIFSTVNHGSQKWFFQTVSVKRGVNDVTYTLIINRTKKFVYKYPVSLTTLHPANIKFVKMSPTINSISVHFHFIGYYDYCFDQAYPDSNIQIALSQILSDSTLRLFRMNLGPFYSKPLDSREIASYSTYNYFLHPQKEFSGISFPVQKGSSTNSFFNSNDKIYFKQIDSSSDVDNSMVLVLTFFLNSTALYQKKELTNEAIVDIDINLVTRFPDPGTEGPAKIWSVSLKTVDASNSVVIRGEVEDTEAFSQTLTALTPANPLTNLYSPVTFLAIIVTDNILDPKSTIEFVYGKPFFRKVVDFTSVLDNRDTYYMSRNNPTISFDFTFHISEFSIAGFNNITIDEVKEQITFYDLYGKKLLTKFSAISLNRFIDRASSTQPSPYKFEPTETGLTCSDSPNCNFNFFRSICLFCDPWYKSSNYKCVEITDSEVVDGTSGVTYPATQIITDMDNIPTIDISDYQKVYFVNIEVSFTVPTSPPRPVLLRSYGTSLTMTDLHPYNFDVFNSTFIADEVTKFNTVLANHITAYRQAYTGATLRILIASNPAFQTRIRMTSLYRGADLSKFMGITIVQGFLELFIYSRDMSNTLASSTSNLALMECKVSSSSTTCTECYPTTYLNSENKCSSCTTNCLDCSSGTTCNVCATGFTINNGFCVSCNDKCTDCGSLSCNTCSSGTSLYFNYFCLDSPKCQDGTFLLNGACTPCDKKCSACSVTSTNCTSCNSGYSLDQNNCLLCNSPCALCSGSDNNCVACNEFYQLLNGQCVACPAQCTACDPVSLACSTCKTGWFLSNGQCESCATNCLECSGLASCTSCSPGYYLDQGVCQACSVTCSSCTTAKSSCYKCNYRFFDSGSGCSDCSDTNCHDCSSKECITCKDGFWLQGSWCTNCGSHCDICSGPNGDCTTCSNGYSLSKGACSVSAVCQAECTACNSGTCSACIDGYFVSSGSCQACDSLCSKCVGASNFCSACASGATLVGNSCQKTLPPHCLHEITEGGASQCNLCDSDTRLFGGKCLICPSQCKSCVNNDNLCTDCNDGFYLSTNNCLPCSPECKTCVATDYQCTQCHDGFTLSGYKCVSSQSSNSRCTHESAPGVCDTCANGYRLFNGVCLVCPSRCSTCVTADNKCSSCINGYFLSNDDCASCNSPCPTCSGAADICTSCVSGMTLVGSTCKQTSSRCQVEESPGVCQSCITGYRLFSGSCLTCPTVCSSCSGSDNKCSACISGYYLLGDTCAKCSDLCLECSGSSSSCTACPPGSTLSSAGCLQCSSKCLQCSSVDGQCTQCWPEFRLFVQDCLKCHLVCSKCDTLDFNCTECWPGLYMVDNICRGCSSNCATCQGSFDRCTSCEKGKYLVGSKCLPCDSSCYECEGAADSCKSCNRAMRLNNEKCVPCSVGCLACDAAANVCTKCSEGFQLWQNACLRCPSECSFCDTSDNNCVSCIPGYALSGNICQPTQTTFQPVNPDLVTTQTDSMIDSNLAVAKGLKVSVSVLSPQSSSKKDLASIQDRMKNPYQLSCPPKFFASNQKCLSCPPDCLTCKDALTCETCDTGYEITPQNTCKAKTVPPFVLVQQNANLNSSEFPCFSCSTSKGQNSPGCDGCNKVCSCFWTLQVFDQVVKINCPDITFDEKAITAYSQSERKSHLADGSIIIIPFKDNESTLIFSLQPDMIDLSRQCVPSFEQRTIGLLRRSQQERIANKGSEKTSLVDVTQSSFIFGVLLSTFNPVSAEIIVGAVQINQLFAYLMLSRHSIPGVYHIANKRKDQFNADTLGFGIQSQDEYRFIYQLSRYRLDVTLSFVVMGMLIVAYLVKMGCIAARILFCRPFTPTRLDDILNNIQKRIDVTMWMYSFKSMTGIIISIFYLGYYLKTLNNSYIAWTATAFIAASILVQLPILDKTCRQFLRNQDQLSPVFLTFLNPDDGELNVAFFRRKLLRQLSFASKAFLLIIFAKSIVAGLVMISLVSVTENVLLWKHCRGLPIVIQLFGSLESVFFVIFILLICINATASSISISAFDALFFFTNIAGIGEMIMSSTFEWWMNRKYNLKLDEDLKAQSSRTHLLDQSKSSAVRPATRSSNIDLQTKDFKDVPPMKEAKPNKRSMFL